MGNRVRISENFINTIKPTNSKNLYKIFPQNIRGLESKVDELSNSLLPDYPSIMCLTEYHLRDHEIGNLSINQFQLGSKFYRHDLKNGGVCIFVPEGFEFSSIPLDKYCKEKDIEVCAVRLQKPPTQLIILAIYRSPSGNFTTFFKNLDSILSTWYSNKIEFVVCGDININYLENCKKRQQLDALLKTYNIIGTVSFPTYKLKASSTAIDNIFITRTKIISQLPIPISFRITKHR
jgi:exonuclease III